MIREHAFNTAWWGKPVGIISDLVFFQKDPHEQRSLLEKFSWVEFSSSYEEAPPFEKVQDVGFMHVDTQLHFRIGLQKIKAESEARSLDVSFADRHPFRINLQEASSFHHERFIHVPGMDQTKLNDRYVRWANHLIDQHPAWCVEVKMSEQTQGWFLSETGPHGLSLTLALLRKDAQISGLHLYARSLAAYAERGAILGMAGFSVTNVAVHNIYANLGAVFQRPTGRWLWVQKP